MLIKTVKVKADTELGYMIINLDDMSESCTPFDNSDEIVTEIKPATKTRKSKPLSTN